MRKVLTKEELEANIAELNYWLDRNKNHPKYKLITCNRNFYVKRLIHLETNNLETVTI